MHMKTNHPHHVAAALTAHQFKKILWLSACRTYLMSCTMHLIPCLPPIITHFTYILYCVPIPRLVLCTLAHAYQSHHFWMTQERWWVLYDTPLITCFTICYALMACFTTQLSNAFHATSSRAYRCYRLDTGRWRSCKWHLGNPLPLPDVTTGLTKPTTPSFTRLRTS